MSPTNEVLMMQTLERLANEVNSMRVELKEHRDETARLAGVVIRLESIQAAQTERCVLKHEAIDSKLDNLDEFKETTGVHEVANLRSQIAKRNEWVVWVLRTCGAALLATSLAGGGYFARGCSPVQQIQVTK